MSKRFFQSLSILFVALLMLQSVVSIFVYDLKLHSIRKKFKWETLNKLQDSQLTLVKVAKVLEQNPNPYFKREHNREFQFLGEMYDIVRKTAHSDTTYYYCFHDSDESEVVRDINQWMHDNFGDSSNSKDKTKAMKDAFKQPYIANTITQLFPPQVTHLNITEKPFSILRFSLQTFSPPPEMS